MIAKRDIGKSILFSILTCGIYGAFWFVKLTDDMNELSDPYEDNTSGVLALIFSILTCGIYGIYWAYKMGKRIYNLQDKYGMAGDDKSVLYIIISLLGFQIINLALIQSDMNAFIDVRRGLNDGGQV